MVMLVDRRIVYVLSSRLDALSICGLVVDGTVVNRDNSEEKTKVVADIRM